MEVTDVYTIQTDDKESEVVYSELVGKPLPYAFFVNLNSHGYAKFKVDKRSLKAFEEKFGVSTMVLIFYSY